MYPVKKILLLPTLITMIFSAGISAQIIITSASPYASVRDELSVVWEFRTPDRYFAAIEQSCPSSCEILDNNGEDGCYFWAEGGSLNETPVIRNNGIHFLWQDPGSALIKIDDLSCLKKLPGDLELTMLTGRTHRPVSSEMHTGVPKQAAYAGTESVGMVIDSVRLDNLRETVEHLSGESPFTLNGTEETILSRYSYNYQIYTARDYLREKLESYGYTPQLHPFYIASPKRIAFSDTDISIGYAAYDSGIYTSEDQGLTWEESWKDSQQRTVYDICKLDSDAAYAVGSRGLILYKPDRDTEWIECRSAVSSSLYSVFFTTPSHGWACGADGTIIVTEDCGETWQTLQSQTESPLYSIYFIDSQKGWAAGRNGTLLSTDDSGMTWLPRETGTQAWFRDIFFTSGGTGWLAGTNGTLLTSVDAGRTWNTISIPTTASLLDIHFSSPDVGYLAGRGRTLLKTADGGQTWQSCSAVPGNDIYTVSVLAPDILLTGSDFQINRSSDSGDSFQPATVLDIVHHNVSATKTGTLYPEKYFIICAHYDAITRGGYASSMTRAPGADDNASGTAAVLEAARLFADYDFDYSVRFVLFSAEEIGLVGSWAYAGEAYANQEAIMGVINLDMIGYDSDDDGVIEFHTNYANTQMIDSMMVWADTWQLNLAPVIRRAGSNSDHAPFLYYGYTAMMFIEDYTSDFNQNYHTRDDLIQYMNMPYFHNNAKLAIGTLAGFAGIRPGMTSVGHTETVPVDYRIHAPFPNPFNPQITIGFELSKESPVTVDIVDVLGRLVQPLFNGRKQAGNHSLTWSGVNRSGITVPSGVYFIRYGIDSRTSELKKIVLLK